jgi:hypothetical protein
LIPLIVGLSVGGLTFFVMLLFVWELLHGGPELRDHWIWLGGATFYVIPAAGGLMSGWLVRCFLNREPPSTAS